MLSPYCLLHWASALGAVAAIQQEPLSHDYSGPSLPPTARVAIIGAGAAGASAAHYLSRDADELNLPLQITVYESSSRVGGRSTTINILDDPAHPVELGASIFVKVNHILVDAVQRFNLSVGNYGASARKAAAARARLMGTAQPPDLGIWDGRTFVYMQARSGSWFDNAKLFWRYGMAPLRAFRAMKDTVSRFERMYDAPLFPWSDLGAAVEDVGLLGQMGQTGAQLLEEKGVGDLFARELVQAATRVNYASNLGRIHGVETMVCLAAEGAMAVEGGNWQIFDRMIGSSGAELRLNTSVTAIERMMDGTDLFYAVTSSVQKSNERGTVVDSTRELYDAIVLASPFQFTNISLTPPPPTPLETIPYVKLHVTIFATPRALSPTYFNLAPGKLVPSTVLTTLPPDISPSADDEQQDGDDVGFFSISIVHHISPSTTNITNPLTVYKVFSARPLSQSFLLSILDIPPTNRQTNTSKSEDAEEATAAMYAKHIPYTHRKIWHSYPREYPRVTFGDTRIDSRFYYTSPIESFISTMETSALSGKSVARALSAELKLMMPTAMNGVGSSDMEDGQKLETKGGQRGEGEPLSQEL